MRLPVPPFAAGTDAASVANWLPTRAAVYYERLHPPRGFPWRTIVERTACLLALPLLGLGIWLSVRLALADSAFHRDTPDSLAEAARLEPGNATYHDLLAETIEGQGGNPDAEWERAVRLSPLEASHWIGLGTRAEVERDYPRAEKYLLHAAQVDVGFEPRWALMNFYFRRGNLPEFSVWTRRALEISYGDLTPVFRLCWLATSDPRAIERMLPPAGQPVAKATELQYLQFLLGTRRFDAARPIAYGIAAQADDGNLPILIQYCDAMVEGHTDAALDVWNVLCRRKLIPFDPLTPAGGNVITNGDFRIKPAEHGFDWRIPRIDGVFVTVAAASEGSPSAGGASLEMSGNEPEECLLMAQIVPVAPGRRYHLDYEYRGAAAEDDSGLRWEIDTLDSPSVAIHSDDLKMTGDWSTGRLNFNPGAAHAARLTLRYKRALGTVRYQGTVALRKVAIEVVP